MTSNLARSRTAALGLVLALGLAACGGDDGTAAEPDPAGSSTPAASEPAADSATPASGSLEAADQSGDGTTLSVDAVTLDGVSQGWVAVHRDLDGKPGPVVGTAQVQGGTSQDVVVTLDETVTTGAFWPMLHVDDSEIGTYEFPQVEGADLPVVAGGTPVMQQVTLTVG